MPVECWQLGQLCKFPDFFSPSGEGSSIERSFPLPHTRFNELQKIVVTARVMCHPITSAILWYGVAPCRRLTCVKGVEGKYSYVFGRRALSVSLGRHGLGWAMGWRSHANAS